MPVQHITAYRGGACKQLTWRLIDIRFSARQDRAVKFSTLWNVVADLWRFSRESRKIAFFLLAAILFAFGAIILLAENTVLMPFIYTLF